MFAEAALELSWGAIAGIISAGLGAAGTALRVVWSYFIKREKDKTDAWKQVVSDKDDIIKAKDKRIEELSKELSRKSDRHAETIQELMTLTLSKVEEWSGKQEKLLDRSLNVQAEFKNAVESLQLGPSDPHEPRRRER